MFGLLHISSPQINISSWRETFYIGVTQLCFRSVCLWSSNILHNLYTPPRSWKMVKVSGIMVWHFSTAELTAGCRSPWSSKAWCPFPVTWMMQFTPHAHLCNRSFTSMRFKSYFQVSSHGVNRSFILKWKESAVILHYRVQHRSNPLPQQPQEQQRREVTVSGSWIQEMVPKSAYKP